MADFKLGVSGSESNLPTCVVDELPCDSPDAIVSAEMLDGSVRSNAKTYVPRTWTLEWDWLTSTECDGLDTLSALKVALNYINGYQGLAAGVTVKVKKPFQRYCTPRCRLLGWAVAELARAVRAGDAEGLRRELEWIAATSSRRGRP